MARTSLRKIFTGMEVNDRVVTPRDYEETTVRNNASLVGRTLGRKYRVAKDVETRTMTVIRIA